jgi:hypothetical protein
MESLSECTTMNTTHLTFMRYIAGKKYRLALTPLAHCMADSQAEQCQWWLNGQHFTRENWSKIGD